MKLVRDNVPVLFPDLVYFRATDTLYEMAVSLKLTEELGEVLSAHTRKDRVSELGDLSDVLDAFMKIEGITQEEVDNARKAKADAKGSFNVGWVLVD